MTYRLAILSIGALALVACGAQGASPSDDDPSQDSDGDNVADGLGTTVDADGDGIPDQIDVNGDGLLDGVGIDTDGDGKPDGIGVDTNGDGIFDAVDTNGDPVTPAGDGDGDSDIVVDPNMIKEDETTTTDCQPKPIGLLRDFQSIRSSASPIKDDLSELERCPVYGDFQAAWENPVDFLGHPEQGIPATTLGEDRKPVISDPDFDFNTIVSAETYHAWYRDDPLCNMTFEYELPMTISPVTGNLVYDSSAFFPLDNMGFGTSGHSGHNFHFTFELHMTFVYKGGEIFSFSGDDDLWVFIDEELVIDLGGAHASMDASVELDSLGLEVGKEYPIDFFHAERAEGESNFHIETSLTFTNCDPIIVR